MGISMIPIAETFHSIQGEGTHVGRPMHFIRLAGCTVGESQPAGENEFFPILSTGHSAFRCRTWDGRPFWCDTDFRKTYDATVEQLLEQTWETRVCLTGGEPLIHQQRLIQQGFFQQFWEKGKMIHVETSGTIKLHPSLQLEPRLWVTVAPKAGVLDEMIDQASEIKFLVDENFDPAKLPLKVLRHQNVFLSPINGEHAINEFHKNRTMEWLNKFPHWRLSVQLHKYLGLR